MSETRRDPNFKPQKNSSGNEGRLHPHLAATKGRPRRIKKSYFQDREDDGTLKKAEKPYVNEARLKVQQEFLDQRKRQKP